MAIDTLKQEEGAVEEGEGVGDVDTTRDIISENELQLFCDSLSNTLQNTASFQYTLDYFDPSIGILYSKDHPTCLNFCVALLREILCNLKPNHELWDKIQYAAFLLNLATRNIDFNILYEIFHQVETNVNTNHWSWREAQVKAYVTERIAEKIIVKDDVCSLPDIDDIKRDSDYEDDNYDDPAVLPLEDDFNDNNDDFADDDYTVVDAKEERLPKAEDLPNEETSDKKFDVKKVTKTEKPKKAKKRKRKVEEEEQPKVKRKRGRPRKDGIYSEESSSGPKTEYDKTKKICHVCKFRAKTLVELEKHAFEVHEANRLCTQCGHLSDTYDDYVKHDKSHLFNCDMCQKKILGSKNLRKHMKTHETKKEDSSKLPRVPCDVCGQLLRENSIYSHMRLVHCTEVHKCDLCDFTTNAKSRLDIHRKKHFNKAVECPECGKVVKDMRKHLLRKCGNSKEKERHFCHLCDKSFSYKESLDKHIKHIHQKIMKFHCEHCDYKTYSGFNLRIHISKMHTKEDMKKNCHFCNQNVIGLDYHIRIYHMDEHLKSQANKQESLEEQLRSPDLQINNQEVPQLSTQMHHQSSMEQKQAEGSLVQILNNSLNVHKQEAQHSLDAPT
eukprot:TRINITY_DN2504_c2_g2_i1.p1 TRINITY_DN2504_c2_g2~~TRINITY_DN2504_c2_g2_i1.p1  ORF type:complete len:612 (+),score=137.26 TRINITY_DN2504_c2_g2_i1:81-1916(+)